MEKVLTSPLMIGLSKKTKYLFRQGAIAIGVGYLYFGMVVMNPLSFLAGASSLASFVNIRWANILRALVLTGPGAVIGIAGGAMAFNIHSGKFAFSMAYYTMPFINIAVGLTAYSILKKIGKSFWKELSVIAIYGLVMGIFVTMNLTAISLLLQGTTWGKLLTLGAFWKILNHAIVPVIGYLMLRPIIHEVRSWSEKGSSTK